MNGIRDPGSRWALCRAQAGAPSWTSLLVLIVLGPLAAGCAVAIDPQAIADAQTAARVRTALVNDPELGTRPIEVRVSKGVAALIGRVLSDEERERAVSLARGVPGVHEVDNRLQVAAGPVIDAPAPEPGGDPALDRELLELQEPPGLFAVGLSVSRTHPLDGALASRVAIGPMVKLGSGRGLAPVIGFNWFQADLVAPGGTGQAISRLRVRPFMAGAGYTVGPDHVSITTSFVAGIAFNSLRVVEPAGGPLALDVGNSFVWRANATVWRNLTQRTVLNVSAGYINTRLRVTVLDGDSTMVRRVSGNTVVVSTGVAYRIF